jgi:hypothetical protein
MKLFQREKIKKPALTEGRFRCWLPADPACVWASTHAKRPNKASGSSLPEAEITRAKGDFIHWIVLNSYFCNDIVIFKKVNKYKQKLLLTPGYVHK